MAKENPNYHSSGFSDPPAEIGEREFVFLQLLFQLSEEFRTAVSLDDLAEHLGWSRPTVEESAHRLTDAEAVEWPRLGHLLPTVRGKELLAAAVPESSGPAEIASQGRTQFDPAMVTVIIPALNEARTIGRLVRVVKTSSRVREVIVVDDGSTDDTVEMAAQAGARVMMSTLLGKGASMEDGVRVAQGKIILFLDADLEDIRPDIVEVMTDPILAGEADLVKAAFSREAGRVTVLTARPLLSAFFPELERFQQPLGGILAARTSLLRGLRFENDYGVDVGLLIDSVVAKGAAVSEVHIGRIAHESQSLEALGVMAKQVARVILDRAWRYERLSINSVREMEEAERRVRAALLPNADQTTTPARHALLDMDGVLLNSRYVAEVAQRIGARAELDLLLDNHTLTNEQRAQMIASLFTGVHKEIFEEAARSMPLVPGAPETVVALRKAGYRVVVVTDSFHLAAEIVRRRVFADFCVAHLMHFRHGRATGELTLAPATIAEHGCKEHYSCKANVLLHLATAAGLRPFETVAVGDNVNDVCLLRSVGMSVAFEPKSKIVEEAARYTVSAPLTNVLDVLGIPNLERATAATIDMMARNPGTDTSTLNSPSLAVPLKESIPSFANIGR